MRHVGQVVLAILLLAGASFASQIAVLRNGFSIHHERRSQIGTMTRLFTSADSASYVDIPTDDIDHFEIDSTPAPKAAPAAVPPAPSPAVAHVPMSPQTLDQIIGQASDAHQIDPDFINSVIEAESGFHVRAVSPKGAQGLMQLMPDTATNLGVSNAFDAKANVEGGTRYLRSLLEKYNFDVAKALAAYNAGPQRVDHYHGMPPYYETQAYVARIIRDYNRKKLAEQKAAKARVTGQVSTTSKTRTTRATSRPNGQPVAAGASVATLGR